MADFKTIVMYLPQYHYVVENSQWWGEGFTDWTAVRQAQKLFSEHNQPRIPLDYQYYNLLDKDTLKWQADLAAEYGIDGFCIFHYWFKNGRKILEKPVELLYNCPDIPMPFCFAWANDAWARSWSGIKGANCWSDKFEDMDHAGSAILLEQDYGDETLWKEHFAYFLPFFRDRRYIKYKGCPVLCIYNVSDISCIDDMLQVWRCLAKKEGFPDLYIIGRSFKKKSYLHFDAVMQTVWEKYPFRWRQYSERYGCNVLSYDSVWENLLRQSPVDGKDTIMQCRVDFDDTPRRGKNGLVFLDVSVDKFQFYFKRLVEKTKRQHNPFLFINAWNEWGEGMYLEPDITRKYGFLEVVRSTLN